MHPGQVIDGRFAEVAGDVPVGALIDHALELLQERREAARSPAVHIDAVTAYGMLTVRDRQVGHLLAGEWLERSGDADPIALAEHFERGGQPARAAAAFLSAAELALRGDDLVAAIAAAERGVACALEPATVGALRLVQAEAHRGHGRGPRRRARASGGGLGRVRADRRSQERVQSSGQPVLST